MTRARRYRGNALRTGDEFASLDVGTRDNRLPFMGPTGDISPARAPFDGRDEWLNEPHQPQPKPSRIPLRPLLPFNKRWERQII